MVKFILTLFSVFILSLCAGFITSIITANNSNSLLSPLADNMDHPKVASSYITLDPAYKIPATTTPSVVIKQTIPNSNPISTAPAPTAIVNTTLEIASSPTPKLVANNATPHATLTIHMGSLSMDRHNLTKEDIDSAITAIAENIPNTDFIAIGTYFDYPEQIRLWIESIHQHGFKAYIRSAGFNSWQGKNGTAASGTPGQHVTDIISFINVYHSFFTNGDIFEPFPDEPANGTYWEKYEDGVGTNGSSKDEFNNFIISSLTGARSAFNNHNLSGVVVEVFHDNPLVVKNALTADTINKLTWIGTDNYPEKNKNTPEEISNAMRTEIQTWITGTHNDPKWNITFGPSIYTLLGEAVQASAYKMNLEVIKAGVPNLSGVTIWQFGDISNWPPARLFDYVNGKWQPRAATIVLNNY